MKNLTVAVIATLAMTGAAFSQSNPSSAGQKSGDAGSSSPSMQKGDTTGSTSKQNEPLKNGDGSTGNVAGDLNKGGSGSSSKGSQK